MTVTLQALCLVIASIHQMASHSQAISAWFKSLAHNTHLYTKYVCVSLSFITMDSNHVILNSSFHFTSLDYAITLLTYCMAFCCFSFRSYETSVGQFLLLLAIHYHSNHLSTISEMVASHLSIKVCSCEGSIC